MNELKLTEKQKRQFDEYYKFLIAENEKYNLTAITEKQEVYAKHFYDSLQLARVVDFNETEKLMDIGSGAGFPGIPLKIIFPNLRLFIIEPTLKRTRFLAALTEMLGLEGVEIIKGRAEKKLSASARPSPWPLPELWQDCRCFWNLLFPMWKLEDSFLP